MIRTFLYRPRGSTPLSFPSSLNSPHGPRPISLIRNISSAGKTYTDPAFLRGVSLGTLGALIHSTVHDTFRHRWAAAPGGRRPEPGIDVTEIPVEWDDPRYDYLGDTYSMQVNPVYWKFCGWIDDRIENWKVAHGVFGNDFWKGRWIGKMPDAGEDAPDGLHER